MITIDYALAMSEGVGARGGLTDAELDAEAPGFERAVRRVLDEAHAGVLGFWGLPTDRNTLSEIDRWANALEGIDDVIVLGIGGSSLGARAVSHALAGPTELRTGRRLHLPDNSDPWLMSMLLERLDPAKTVAVAISKSGGTVETIAQLLIVRKWLSDGLGDTEARKHLCLVTDPDKGPLRQLARTDDIVAFDVPPNVGGRFSVLSSVGLVPTRLLGLSASEMLDGAAAMAEACARPTLRDNPAGLLAALHVVHQRQRAHSVHVLMPYADALRPFAAWFVQLWAESLGKRRDRQGRLVESGPTPLPAVGATDQHAQVQLFMEGPRDKLVTFIAVDAIDRDLTIPRSNGPFSYLGGTALSTVLDAERRGTALALAEDGRPSLTIHVPRISAETLGALFFLYEAATAFAGELYGIDAFDQPGVELGKRLAAGILGRSGAEDEAARVRDAEKGRPAGYRVSS